MKQYERYKPSGIEWVGEIPAHWDKSRLKWVCRFEYGESLSTNDREEGDFPVYGSNGITGYHSVAISKAPCVIVGRKGSFGKVNWSEKECFPIDTTYYIDSRQTGANLRWLFYGLQQLGLDTFSRDTGVPGLNREDAYQNILPLPSPAEQTAIAAYLDDKTARIDKLIANKQRLIELLKEERTAIINHAVTKGINPKVKLKPSGIEWLGDIPEDWEVKKLKYVAKLKSGDGITADNIRPEGEYPVFGGNGLRGYTETFTHEGNYVLIGRQGALCGNINYAEGKFFASEHAVVVSVTGKSELLWLGELLRTMNLNQYSQASAQPGLSVEKIQNLMIPVPMEEEQAQIVQHIETSTQKIDATISKIEKEIELMQEYRTALISEVVTGKIKVI